MNQRIDQLWAQALDAAVPETYTRLSHSQVLKIKQVFAELIIKECCDIVLAPHNETEFTISMDLCKFSTRQAIDRAAQSGGLKVHTQGISKEIKKHFGVE